MRGSVQPNIRRKWNPAEELIPCAGGIRSLRRPPQRLVQNSHSANSAEFLTEQLYSFGSAMTILQLLGRQWPGSPEPLDVFVNQRSDFVPDGKGWGCHHNVPPRNSLAERIRWIQSLLCGKTDFNFKRSCSFSIYGAVLAPTGFFVGGVDIPTYFCFLLKRHIRMRGSRPPAA